MMMMKIAMKKSAWKRYEDQDKATNIIINSKPVKQERSKTQHKSEHQHSYAMIFCCFACSYLGSPGRTTVSQSDCVFECVFGPVLSIVNVSNPNSLPSITSNKRSFIPQMVTGPSSAKWLFLLFLLVQFRLHCLSLCSPIISCVLCCGLHLLDYDYDHSEDADWVNVHWPNHSHIASLSLSPS